MKVLVVGANGQIGTQVVNLLEAHPAFKVWAMVRKEDQKKFYEEKGISTILADLEHTVANLISAVKGMNAIVFTAGSGGKTGADKTLLIDLDGAVKMMEAAEAAEAKRFVMISAYQANNRENWSQAIKPYYVAKYYADRMLMQSKLDYTIIRPGALLNEAGIGKIAAGEKIAPGSIPRADVAETVVAVLPAKNTFGTSFDLTSGETTITEVVQAIKKEHTNDD